MTPITAGTTKLAHHLLLLNQQQATGELIVEHGKQANLQWHIYFYLGRVVYATGGVHPVRRWYRAFKHDCPECFSANWLFQAQSDVDLWEVDLLNQALGQGHIKLSQYKAVVQRIVQEVMFALLGQKFFTTEWRAGYQIPQQFTLLSVEQLVTEAQQMREQWRNAGLGFLQELMSQFSPDLAPVLRNRVQIESQMSSPSYRSMFKLMRGQHSLWDISVEMQRPLPVILQALLPWIHRGMIELKEIADLPALSSKPSAPPDPVASKPLIACVDGNPAIGRTIAQFLQPDYEVISIFNPLRGIGTLLERKPELIFLNPALSETNGYDFCALLRKTPELQQTPIVMMAHQDSVVDRVRAKFSGASDFVTKPLEASKVQQMAQKYLRSASTLTTGTTANLIEV